MLGRDVKKRKTIRRFAGERAASILRDVGFGRGREAFAISGGDFSSIDWIDAILDYTGPANAAVATWTAASADLDRVSEWVGGARVLSCEWIVDRSFQNRQPDICAAFRERFGDDCIRVAATHAKFSLIWNNDGWRVVALTSANLNQNKRIEFFHVADDADMFAEFWAMKEAIFDDQQPGLGFQSDAGSATALKGLKRRGLQDRAAREGVGVVGAVSLR